MIGSDPNEVLGRVPTGTTLRTELAAAARSRGRSSSFAAEIATIRESMTAIEVPTVDLEGVRRRLATVSGEEERLTERVAAARGDVRARRSVDADVAGALADLEDAAAALSDARTERIAAEQALERARERVATARDARERRLALRDRIRNRRRDARSELATGIHAAFRDALSAVPEGDRADAGAAPTEYVGSTVAASLASVRVADLDGPVVLEADAAAAFDAPDGRDPETTLDVPVTVPDG